MKLNSLDTTMDEFDMYRAQAYNFEPHHNRSKSLPPRRRRKNNSGDNSSPRGGSLRDQNTGHTRTGSVRTPNRRRKPVLEAVELRRNVHGHVLHDHNPEPLSPIINRLRLEESYFHEPCRGHDSLPETRPQTLDLDSSPESGHRRSHSCRSRRSRSPRSETQPDSIRPRTSSLPSKKEEEPCVLKVPEPEEDKSELPEGIYRVRSFQTTSKGIVNRGDSFKRCSRSSRRSAHGSITSHASGSDRASVETESSGEKDGLRESALSLPVFDESPSSPSPAYRVLVMGSSDVGKTALTQQFMTSEYMGNVDTSRGRTVTKFIHF